MASNVSLITQLSEYSGNDMNFGKYFKGVTKFGKEVLAKAFKMLYDTQDTENGTMRVLEYFTEKLKFEKKKWKNFTEQEINMIGNDPNGNEFDCDVTLCCKIIGYIFDKINLPHSDKLRKDIQSLKYLRNTVCHEDIELDDNELDKRMKDLDELCENIIFGAAFVALEQINRTDEEREMYIAEVSNFIREVKHGLNDLLVSEPKSKQDVTFKSYLDEVKTYRKQKQSHIILSGREETVKAYSKLKTLNPFAWISDGNFVNFSVDKIFTSVNLRANGFPVKLADIFELKEKVFVARLLIFSGLMGAGKSSLCRHILHEWSIKSSIITGLNNFDLAIFIDLSSVSNGSLLAYLREQLLKNTLQDVLDSDIIPILHDINILFIIDGMDECKANGKKILDEIINKFTDSRIIITVRPEFTLELRKKAEDHLVIELSGFDSKSRELFVTRVISSTVLDKTKRDIKVAEFMDFLSVTCKSLGEYLSLPLNIALLLVLWIEDSDKVTSFTTASRLHDQILHMCKQKLVSRLQSLGNENEITLNAKVKQWMSQLGQVAWEMLKDDSHNSLLISDGNMKELINSCHKIGIEERQTISAFLNYEQEEETSGIKHRVLFLHSSAEEYFAAMHLAEEIIEQNIDLVNIFQNIKNPRHKELLKFLAGILKIKGALDTSLSHKIINILVDNMGVSSNDFTFWWQLLQEGEQHLGLCNAVQVHIQKVNTWDMNSWDTEDISIAKVSLLKLTNAVPTNLVIDVHYETSLDMHPYMEDLLELLSFTTALNQKPSMVSLYLQRQFNVSEYTTISDKYVSPLLAKNQLIELKCHMGEESTDQLENAYNLQSLFVRISSMKALENFAISLTKHRSCKVFFMPSRKWRLKFIELYLDIKVNTEPTLFPKLPYRKRLVLKIPHIRDEHANWAGRVIKILNNRYESIILTESQLTIKGAKELLDEVDGVTIKVLQIFSGQIVNKEDVKRLIKESRINIGWGKID